MYTFFALVYISFVVIYFIVNIFDLPVNEMARNKRKKIKDKDNKKTVRKEAKKRWRNKKAQEKALKNAAALKPAGPVKDLKAKDDLDITQACECKQEKPSQPKKREKSSEVKEINPVIIETSHFFLEPW